MNAVNQLRVEAYRLSALARNTAGCAQVVLDDAVVRLSKLVGTLELEPFEKELEDVLFAIDSTMSESVQKARIEYMRSLVRIAFAILRTDRCTNKTHSTSREAYA